MARIAVIKEVCYAGLEDFGELTPVPTGGWQFSSYTSSPAPVRATRQEAWQDMTDYAEGIRVA
jgi:hypothetical protein